MVPKTEFVGRFPNTVKKKDFKSRPFFDDHFFFFFWFSEETYQIQTFRLIFRFTLQFFSTIYKFGSQFLLQIRLYLTTPQSCISTINFSHWPTLEGPSLTSLSSLGLCLGTHRGRKPLDLLLLFGRFPRLLYTYLRTFNSFLSENSCS